MQFQLVYLPQLKWQRVKIGRRHTNMPRGDNLRNNTDRTNALAVRRQNLLDKLAAMVGKTYRHWRVLACISTDKQGRFACQCTVCNYKTTLCRARVLSSK